MEILQGLGVDPHHRLRDARTHHAELRPQVVDEDEEDTVPCASACACARARAGGQGPLLDRVPWLRPFVAARARRDHLWFAPRLIHGVEGGCEFLVSWVESNTPNGAAFLISFKIAS